ncbi:MAG: RNB domain-containing ribonuclease, partial [Desulfobulbaceae bacterium]
MARKKYKTRRRVTKKNYRADTYRNRQKNSGEINRLQQRILNFLYLAEAPRKLKEIERAVATSKTGGKEFASALETLVRSGDIIKNNRRAYTISTAASLFEARLEMNHRGFGFAEELSKRDESQLIRQEKGRKAPYISPNNLGSARHDDRILVRVFKTRKDGRAEAEVIGILKRSSDQLVGIYKVGRGFGEVLPEDPRFPFVLKLRTPPPTTIADGSAVLVSVQSTDEALPTPTAEIVKILGKPEHIDVQAQCVINNKRLKEKFSRAAQSEAKETKDLFISQREDLRDILHITIDGADARDFDDAIGILKTRNGFTLFVSIADVSAYVIPGTTLDREAFERGTSVYFPHKVLPMLPEILSNDRCSLVPEQDRPTLTVIMEFSRSGELLKKRFTRGLIYSAHRFTYDTVKHIVIDKDPLTRRNHKPFLTPLKWAYELATILQ